MKRKTSFVLSSIFILILSIISLPLATFFNGGLQGEIIRNSVFSIFFSLGLFYLYLYSYHLNKLDYNNADHSFRFLIVFTIGLFLSLLFPFVDKKAWVFLSIGVAISLFSNGFLALYSISGMIMFSVLLTGGTDLITFFVYFLASFIGIMLFQNIDESFRVNASIMISVIVLTVLEIAGFVFLENVHLRAEQFIFPLVNVMINSLTLMFVLKYFNQVVANKYRNKYLELNDQEFKALIELKEKSKEDYYRSIHTAYLVERMANAINCNVYAAKNCAYYYRLSEALDYSNEDFEQFLNVNEFPPDARKLLLAFSESDTFPEDKEAGLVYISDRIIWTLTSLFKKDSNIKVDYSSLIDTLFEKDYFKNTLENSSLSIKDIKTVKEILKKETLYYDFLR